MNSTTQHKSLTLIPSSELLLLEAKLRAQVEEIFINGGKRKLVKKGKRFGLLTTRYYFIHSEKLIYFKSHDNKKEKGKLELRDNSLKIEFEHKKITKDMLFGIRIEYIHHKAVFWLVSPHQSDNVLLFKYLKLLNGQFQVKRLQSILSSKAQEGSILIFGEGITMEHHLAIMDFNEDHIKEEEKEIKADVQDMQIKQIAEENCSHPHSRQFKLDASYNFEATIDEEEGKQQYQYGPIQINNSSIYFGDNVVRPQQIKENEDKKEMSQHSVKQQIQDYEQPDQQFEYGTQYSYLANHYYYQNMAQDPGCEGQIYYDEDYYNYYHNYQVKSQSEKQDTVVEDNQVKSQVNQSEKQETATAVAGEQIDAHLQFNYHISGDHFSSQAADLNGVKELTHHSQKEEEQNKETQPNYYQELNYNQDFQTQFNQNKEESKENRYSPINQSEFNIYHQSEQFFNENDCLHMTLPVTPQQRNGFSPWFSGCKNQPSYFINGIANDLQNSLGFELEEDSRHQFRGSERMNQTRQMKEYYTSKTFDYSNKKAKLVKSAPQSPCNMFITSFNACEQALNGSDNTLDLNEKRRYDKIQTSHFLQSDFKRQNSESCLDSEEEEQIQQPDSIIGQVKEQISQSSYENAQLSQEELRQQIRNAQCITTSATNPTIQSKQSSQGIANKNTILQARNVLFPSTFKQNEVKNSNDADEEDEIDGDEVIEEDNQTNKENKLKQGINIFQSIKNKESSKNDKFIFSENQLRDECNSSIENCRDECEEGIKQVQIEKDQDKKFIQDYNNLNSPNILLHKSAEKISSILQDKKDILEENIQKEQYIIQEISELTENVIDQSQIQQTQQAEQQYNNSSQETESDILKKLMNLSIYECVEELSRMIWKNMFRGAQKMIESIKSRFKSKQYLLEMMNLEIDLLIISFSGQLEQFNQVNDKIDVILKMIKIEQKNKPNFYDLCLCDINQAELESWKIFSKFESLENKLLNSLKPNPLLNPINQQSYQSTKQISKPSLSIPSFQEKSDPLSEESASQIRQIINKFHFGRGFFSLAFAFLPEGIVSFLKLLGYSGEPSVGIKWVDKCIEVNSVRSNYASILLSLHYVDRKNLNQKGLNAIKLAQAINGKTPSICLSWIQSLLLMNLEEAEQAESVLKKGISLAISSEPNQLPIRLEMIEYELCWLEIVQLKWSSPVFKLEQIICRSLDLNILVQKSKKSVILQQIAKNASDLQKQHKMHLPLKLQMIMHLACCFIEIKEEQKAKAYFQICAWEHAAKPSAKKSHEDISKIAEKYSQRQNLQYAQYEIHYLLKSTSKLSDSLLQKYLPKVKNIWTELITEKGNTSSLISKKVSVASFIAVVNCFVGKNVDNEELYNAISQVSDAELKPYDFILQHFYFWTAMSFFHRKMHSKALEAFEKSKKGKKIEFSIQEKIEKNIQQLKEFIVKDKSTKLKKTTI